MLPEVLKGFFLLCILLIPLERGLALHKNPVFRSGWQTDILHYFVGYFVGRLGIVACGAIALFLLQPLAPASWQTWVAAQPLWLQFLEAVIVADVGYYIAHRLTHTVPVLWKFHAVHHSAQHLDWLVTVRMHPMDQLFTKAFQVIPLYLLGFDLKIWGGYALFSAAIAFFIHANIRLNLGGLQWILATPQFHHWHHSDDPKVYNKNFAAQLPLLDWLFGTLYLSQRQVPTHYGSSEPVPLGYWGQLLYPFRRKRQRLGCRSTHPS